MFPHDTLCRRMNRLPETGLCDILLVMINTIKQVLAAAGRQQIQQCGCLKTEQMACQSEMV